MIYNLFFKKHIKISLFLLIFINRCIYFQFKLVLYEKLGQKWEAVKSIQNTIWFLFYIDFWKYIWSINWKDFKNENSINMFHRIFLMLFTIYRFQVLIEITKKFCESKTIIVTNGLVHNISIEYYNRLTFHPHPALMFNASDHFVIKLKKFIDYSNRRFHIKRIPDIIIQNTVIFL